MCVTAPALNACNRCNIVVIIVAVVAVTVAVVAVLVVGVLRPPSERYCAHFVGHTSVVHELARICVHPYIWYVYWNPAGDIHAHHIITLQAAEARPKARARAK